MQYLPLFASLQQRRVLVVGGGQVALRKAHTLLSAGALLTVVAHTFEAEFLRLAAQGRLQLIEGSFQTNQLEGQFLVVAATGDALVNQEVFAAADARQLLVNSVDDLAHCSFIFPAIIDRSPLLVAISSGGAAPVLARRLREKLEVLLPQYLGPLTELAAKFRSRVKAHLSSLAARRLFWEKAFNSSVVRDVQTGQLAAAEQRLEWLLQQEEKERGEVWLVGAGPGDPELLTLKALQCLQQADIVVYDYLVSPAILQLSRRDAELLCVGKKAGAHSVAQEEINKLLVSLALDGKKVCRLKGGDPFIFGRGGEEIEALLPHHIAFQVVPGITAAAGCAAYAGIALTHRDYAQSVQFITGHCQKAGTGLDWQSLAKPHQTLAIYMGLLSAAEIQVQLQKAGREASTPIAIIENGTRPEQRVITGVLSELGSLITEHQVQSPALLIVGEVVALQAKMAWYGQTVSEHAPNAFLHQP